MGRPEDLNSEFETELTIETALDELTNPNSSSLDIENALTDIRRLRRVKLTEARQLLGCIKDQMPRIVSLVGSEPVFQTISPYLRVIHKIADKNEKQREALQDFLIGVISSLIVADPRCYKPGSDVNKSIRNGQFGEPEGIIGSVLEKVSTINYQRSVPRREILQHAVLVANLFQDLASFQKPELVRQILPKIPAHLLLAEPRFVERFNVLRLVKEALQEGNLTVGYLASSLAVEPDLFEESLEDRILSGEFGHTPEVLRELLLILAKQDNNVDENDREKDESFDDLMSAIFADLTPYSEDLRRVIPSIINQDWYWNRDSIGYCSLQALNALGTPIGNEDRFVADHEDRIFATLRRLSGDEVDEHNSQVLDSLKNQGTFSEKLGAVLKVFRIHGDIFKDEEIQDELSDNFLINCVVNANTLESLVDAKDQLKGFFDLFKQGEPLYGKAGRVFVDLLRSNNPVQRALEIESVFTQNVPFWKQVYMYIETVIPDELTFSHSEYPISKLARLVVPSGEKFDFSKHHQMIQEDISSMDVYDKRGLTLDRLSKLTDEQVKKLETIPFRLLSREAKKLTILNYLQNTMESSQSSSLKQRADERNRAAVSDYLILSSGMFLHGSRPEFIDSVLFHGNLSGECLGALIATDSYPFHVDFHRISQQEADNARVNFQNVIEKTYAGKQGSIIYVYDRKNTEWETGTRYPAKGKGDAHYLLLVGIPSTEISGVILKNPRQDFEGVKKAILENGFYIPVYNLEGKLLFSSEDFDNISEQNNLRVPVEVWSTALQMGDKLGSNEGGIFAIPSEKGARRFYVKYYPKEADLDHLWTEQLADNIYRFVEIPVPETKIVKVGDKFGHASEMLEPDPIRDTTTLKDGFLVDSLLANWDIVYNRKNTISVGGIMYRIDNGGALYFRATGERKDRNFFSETVGELEFGRDRTKLAYGMKQEYLGLTDRDITRQIRVLEEKLTPEAIEILINSVRLLAIDRAYLRNILKQRRGYILSYFA